MIRKNSFLWLVALCSAGLGARACSSPTDPGPDGPRVFLDGQEFVFLTQDRVPSVGMDALFRSRVVTDAAGCLRQESGDAPTVVWPKEFSLELRDGDVAVVDDEGTSVGRVGGSFELAGGIVGSLHEDLPISDAVRDVARDRCPGDYWLVNDR